MDKDMQDIHRMEHYLASKRNAVLVHAVEWMNLKHITLRKKSDTKTTCCLIPSM
jgi:hypothetical protein